MIKIMSYKVGFRSLVFLGVLTCASISIKSSFGNNPPKPFWNWNDRISRKFPLRPTEGPSRMNDGNYKSSTHPKAAKNQYHYDSTKNEPPLFWSYYKNAASTVNKVSTEQGKLLSITLNVLHLVYFVNCLLGQLYKIFKLHFQARIHVIRLKAGQVTQLILHSIPQKRYKLSEFYILAAYYYILCL